MNAKTRLFRKKNLVLGALLLPMLLGMLSSPYLVAAASSPLPSKMELSISGFTFTPYTSYYKTDDALISGRVVNLDFITGLTLLKTDTSLDLSGSTFESDDIALTPSVSLGDRTAYSFTFINDTFDSATTVNATVNTQFAVGKRGTEGSGTATSTNTGTHTVSWQSKISFDENGDGDYVDSGDKAYLPLSGQEYFYVGFSVDFPASVNAATYGEVNLYFERTSGTDYVVHVRAYGGSGDSGWSSVGGTADNKAVFSAYDADAAFIGLTIPVEQLYAEDSSETGSIIGLDTIEIKLNFGAASEQVTITVRNIAVFNSWPALTDATDDDSDFDWNDNTNAIPVNTNDDTDYLFTVITEGTTESYDWTLPLLKDHIGEIQLLKNARILKFTGIAAVMPTSWDYTSTQVEGQSYYLTTENAIFDVRSISNLTALANVFSASNWYLNVTLDNSVFWYTSNSWDQNLVSFTVDGIDKTNTFKNAWSGSITDGTEVQYDIADPSSTDGDWYTIKMVYYSVKDFEGSGSLLGGGAGIAIIPSGKSMSEWLLDLIQRARAGDLTAWMTIIASTGTAIIVAYVLFFSKNKVFGKKKGR